MRPARIFNRAMLGGSFLLLVAGCASGSSNLSAAANDPPPAPSSTKPAPVHELAVPLQSSSGIPVTTSSQDSSASDIATAFDNVDLVNSNLVGKLAILRVGSNRTEANLLSVFVGLKNETAHVLQLEVQTIYKDDSGQALTQGTGNWIPMKLKPREEADYRSVAISEDATDFLVRIRRTAGAPTGGGQSRHPVLFTLTGPKQASGN